jgi:hypothetical protein
VVSIEITFVPNFLAIGHFVQKLRGKVASGILISLRLYVQEGLYISEETFFDNLPKSISRDSHNIS